VQWRRESKKLETKQALGYLIAWSEDQKARPATKYP
jgi:hypothetical protein